MKKIRKTTGTILTFAIMQIIMLILMSISTSYIIHQANNKVNNIEEKKDVLRVLIEKGVNLLIGFLKIKEIGMVSAQEVEMYCCPKTNNNAICQDVLSTETGICKEEVIPTECKNTNDCTYGCCINNINGECTPRSPKKMCIGGTWMPDENCVLPECEKACCVLGNEYKFTNEKTCEYFSSTRGVEKDFRSEIKAEGGCLSLANTVTEGACAIQGSCSIKTGADCLKQGGNFAQGAFCSDPELKDSYNYDYKPKDHQECYERDIYYFDDKKNREGIAIDCKSQGEKCVVESLGPVCKSLDCDDPYFEWKYGRKPKNGESWCVYEGMIDNGRDTVGSEQWLANCFEGEVNQGRGYELCGNYRKGICSETMIEQGSETFSIAGCVVNEASECSTYNDLLKKAETDKEKQDVMEQCKKNTHCKWENVYIDEYFKFDICLPRYPVGSTLDDSVDDGLCKFDTTCKVIYQKNSKFSKWHCYENCECEQAKFTETLNNVCYSLGDCGSYINYLGKGTDNSYYTRGRGYKIGGDGKEKGDESDYSACDHSNNAGTQADCQNDFWQNYIENANPSKDQHVNPQEVDEYLSSIIGSDSLPGTTDYNTKVYTWISSISGGIGLAAAASAKIAAAIASGAMAKAASAFVSVEVSEAVAAVNSANAASGFAATAGTIAWAAVGFGLGAAVGWALVKTLGINGNMVIPMMLGGGIAGVGAALLLGAGPGTIGNPAGIIIGAIGLVIMAFSWLFSDEYETRYIDFHCMPWTPPAGGADCEKCGNLGGVFEKVPCTKYKCDSLGTMCKLLNEDQENPICVSMKPDNKAPIISPLQVSSAGYDFTGAVTNGVKIRKDDRVGCVPQGNQLIFSLKTDKYTQCKWSFNSTSTNYENMEGEYPVEGTLYAMNHTFKYTMPRVDTLNPTQISGSIPDRKGHLTMYLRCKDAQDPAIFNFNLYAVDICIDEKDLDPVNHAYTRFTPADASKLKLGTTSQEVLMWINEPAECKYDTMSRSYDLMSYSFSCQTGINQIGIWGWPCKTNLTLTGETNKIYIRCKDQPWLDENDPKRNVNGDDKTYTLYITQSPLVIDSIRFKHDTTLISPGEKFKVGGASAISVDMQVTTSGGSDNGIARCSWGIKQDGSRWQMYNTYLSAHSQILSPRYNGTHINYIDCEDIAGNTDSKVANFTIELDNNIPKIIGNRTEGKNLILITDEDADCYYRNDYCNFNLSEGNGTVSMTTNVDVEHYILDFSKKRDYYIMCQDGWNNKGCSLKITATEVNDYKAPEIIRAYHQGNSLIVITNEDAKCYYNLEDCSFEAENGTSMCSYNYCIEHSALWDENKIYYVKCVDSWGNKNNNECAIIAKPTKG